MIYDVELRKSAFSAWRLRTLLPHPHIHPHLEMVYIKKGRSMAVLGDKQYLLKDGDLFLTFPNQLHFYQDQTAVDGYISIFSPEILPDFSEIFQTQIPVAPVWQDTAIPMNVSRTLRTISQKLQTGLPVDLAAAKGYLLALVGELFAHARFTEKPGDSETILRILNYCIANYTKPISLDSLARESYLNKYYISHIFRERLNMSYKDFLTRLRLDHACRLLKEHSSVTEAAYASGFSSVKTFNRTFRSHMGMAPRDYARQPEGL